MRGFAEFKLALVSRDFESPILIFGLNNAVGLLATSNIKFIIIR